MGVLKYLTGALDEETTETRTPCSGCNGRGFREFGDPSRIDHHRVECSACNGTGVYVGRWGCGSELILRLFVVTIGFVLLLVLTFITVVVPVQLWVQAGDPLRSILEALPLGGAVAENPADDGQPIVIAVLTGLPVIAAVILLTRWRRQLVRRHLDVGDRSVPLLMGASLVRTFVFLVMGTLVVALALIAAGADLESDSGDNQLRPGVVLITIAAAGWIGFTWYGLRRVLRRFTKKNAKKEEALDEPEDVAAVTYEDEHI